MNDSLMDDIREKSRIQKNLKIVNKDGRIWIIPQHRIKTGLALYQPSSIRGKVLKMTLPMAQYFPQLIRLVGITEDNGAVNDQLNRLFCSLFHVDQVECSFFGGTPGTHQKITIQIARGNEILGYCKITDKRQIFDLFKSEESILAYLNGRGINNIPACLFDRKAGNLYVFVQSSNKSVPFDTAHQINDLVINTIKDFCDKTTVNIPFDATEYDSMLKKLYDWVPLLNDSDQELVKKAAEMVEEYLAGISDFSCMHRDFTPWNMYLKNDHIELFDFEYARKSYPKYIDLFHFLTQSEIFEKHSKSEKIYSHFKKIFVNGKCKQLFECPYHSYLCYLLDILCLYLQRDHNSKMKDTHPCINIWIELIRFVYTDLLQKQGISMG